MEKPPHYTRSAILGEIKVTASVIHPSRPVQLKGNSGPRLQVGGGALGGGSVCVCVLEGVVLQVFMFPAPKGQPRGLLAPPPAPLKPSPSRRQPDFPSVFLSAL